MNSTSKLLVGTMFLIFLFSSCSKSLVNLTISPNCPNPKQTRIAVLPMLVEGNPERKQEASLSDKFAIKLMELGYQVVDRSIVESQMAELKINYDKPLSFTQMKQIADALKVDALFMSTLTYVFRAATSESEGSGYGDRNYGSVNASSKSIGGMYFPTSESIKIINPVTSETYLTGYVPQSMDGSYMMSDEIIKVLSEKLSEKFQVK